MSGEKMSFCVRVYIVIACIIIFFETELKTLLK